MVDGNERRLGSQYVLAERIGRGAMGTVWRGRDTDTGEPVAIKILAEELCEDPDVLARFVQERTVLLGIRHQHLVSVHDMVVERNRLALMMDLVPGGDLNTLSSGPASASAAATSATATPSKTTPTPEKTTPSATATPVVNFAMHANVSVSSSVSKPYFAASNLTNGVFGTTSTDEGWSSKKDAAAATTEWVSLELATTSDVAEVNMYPRVYEGKVSCFPKSFTIAVSTDGTHWTTVLAKAGYTATGASAQRFYFKQVSAKYIKITATSLTQDAFKDYYLQFQQLSAY